MIYTLDEKMTKEELQLHFGEKRCKPEPVEPCGESKHGCCLDNFHSAKGPFYEGIVVTFELICICWLWWTFVVTLKYAGLQSKQC